MSPRDELFQEAKARGDLAGLCGVKSWRRGACPLCNRGKGDTAFWHGRGVWKCHRCGEGGDVIELARLLWGVAPATAARRLLGLPEDGSADSAPVREDPAERR